MDARVRRLGFPASWKVLRARPGPLGLIPYFFGSARVRPLGPGPEKPSGRGVLEWTAGGARRPSRPTGTAGASSGGAGPSSRNVGVASGLWQRRRWRRRRRPGSLCCQGLCRLGRRRQGRGAPLHLASCRGSPWPSSTGASRYRLPGAGKKEKGIVVRGRSQRCDPSQRTPTNQKSKRIRGKYLCLPCEDPTWDPVLNLKSYTPSLRLSAFSPVRRRY